MLHCNQCLSDSIRYWLGNGSYNCSNYKLDERFGIDCIDNCKGNSNYYCKVNIGIANIADTEDNKATLCKLKPDEVHQSLQMPVRRLVQERFFEGVSYIYNLF